MSFISVPLVAVTGGLPLGGSSTFLVNFARAMRRRGLVLPVVSLAPENAYAADFHGIGNPVLCLPSRQMIYEDRLLWSYQQTARYQPRAVLSCLSSESFEVLRVAPKGVLRMGIVQSDDPGPYAVMKRYGPWMDVAVGVSREITDNLQVLPELRHAKLESIPYGIDFPARHARCLSDANAPLRVIYLGRLIEEQKRISRIVRLAQILDARKADVDFTIAGDGPQREQVRAELSTCPRVRLRDAVPYDQISALLREQEVVVLLSDYEGLPLSLLEAMGCGVVPIVTDLPSGISEVVGESRGFRVPLGNAEVAAEILIQLSQDRPRLLEYSQNAEAFVRKHHGADEMAAHYCGLINRLTGPAPSWPGETKVPAPLGVDPAWLFHGLPRVVRRWTKRLLGARLSRGRIHR